MALADESITVACGENKRLECHPCGTVMESRNIFCLFRRTPGGEFFPMCGSCGQEVIRAAAFTLNVEDQLSRLLE